jgi:hypothetical protein
MKLKCYYRLCDKARMGWGYTWKICFDNFIKHFQPNSDELIVYIDNSEEETIKSAVELCEKNKFEFKITKYGNSMSFYKTAEEAITNSDDTIIYFVENDYLHRPGSKTALFEIFNTYASDNYVTLYDHPDKYYPYFWDTNTNRYANYCELEENRNIKSKIHYLKSGWWRTVPTTCMTFACMADTLKEDFEIIKKWTEPYGADRPKDFDMFNELIKNGRELYSSIPSYSSHTSLMATGFDWRTL